MNYLQGTKESPYHISVGAVVVDSKNRVLVEYFENHGVFSNVYSLMRKTVQPDETLQQTLVRGLKEELNIEGELTSYIGSKVTNEDWFEDDPTPIQKTTLYFLVNVHDNNTNVTENTYWIEIDELIAKYEDQAKRIPHTDFHEADILKRARVTLSV